jgi:hypothetical protein
MNRQTNQSNLGSARSDIHRTTPHEAALEMTASMLMQWPAAALPKLLRKLVDLVGIEPTTSSMPFLIFDCCRVT